MGSKVSRKGRKVVSTGEAAEILGVHQQSVRRFISQGKLRAYRIGTRSLRVELEDVYRMLKPVASAADR